MATKTTPPNTIKKSNNEADQRNKNKGTSGTNTAFQLALDNRSRQIERTKKRK